MKKFLTFLILMATPLSCLPSLTKNNADNIKSVDKQNDQINLNLIITEHNLGNIVMQNDIPSKLELLTAIIKVNKKAVLLTLNDFILKDVATGTGCFIMGIGKYDGDIMLQYSKQLIPIDVLIAKKSLNSIIFSNYMLPSKEDLLTAIKDLNPLAIHLTIDDFVIIDTPTVSKATIMGVNSYCNNVTLTYSQQNVRTQLNSIITTKNLNAIIFTNNMLPSKEDLLTAILNLNPTASNLTVNDFAINDTPTAATASIMGMGRYQGLVTLTYSQQNAPVDIAKLITVLNLGKISIIGLLPPNKTQLLNGIQAVNPKAKILTLNNFALFDLPTTTSATIYGIGDNYRGLVTVNYRII